MSTLKSKVTVTRLHKIEGKNWTVGIADISINGEFAINGVTLARKNGVVHLVFPFRVSSKKGAKEYLDICHPLTAESRQTVTQLVVQEFETKYGNGETVAA